MGSLSPPRASGGVRASGVTPVPAVPRLALIEERRYTLPAQPAPLIGRERELAVAVEQMLQPHVRLLTFTGAGGSGKTRLAVEVAAAAAPHFEHGALFVDLSPIADPDLVASTIAHALGLGETEGEPMESRLVRALRGSPVLLLLDNFEQVLPAAPLLARLLAACDRLKLIVTSREPLRLRWERQFPVQPLDVPDIEQLPPPDELARVPAVALFVERAQAVNPSFSLTADYAPAVAEICVRLDGLPLAIELAASRTQMFSPPSLLERLQNRLNLLVDGPRDLPARHRTLRDAIAWSYELLSAHERSLFRRVAIFSGGCTKEAMMAVAGGSLAAGQESPAGIPADDAHLAVMTGLEALLSKGLLRREVAGSGEVRFIMLETIREFALDALAAEGEANDARLRHAAYYVALAEQAEPELQGPQQVAWLARLAREHDNLRAALQWLVDRRLDEPALRLGSALWRFWQVRGHWTEGRERLAALLDQPPPAGSESWRAKAQYGAGMLAWAQGDYAAARHAYDRSLELWQQLDDRCGIARAQFALGLLAWKLGDQTSAVRHYETSLTVAREAADQRGMADALNALGIAAGARGDYAAAAGLLEQSLALRRALADTGGVAMSLLNLGNVARAQRDTDRARQLYEESLELFRQIDSRLGIATTAENLGNLAHARGDYLRAAARFEESLAVRQATGDRPGMATCLARLGMVALARGDHATARRRFVESLTLRRALQSKDGVAEALEGLAALAVEHGQPERALVLAGAAAALRAATGVALSPDDREALEGRLAAARRVLGERKAEAAWEQGQALQVDELFEVALAGEPVDLATARVVTGRPAVRTTAALPAAGAGTASGSASQGRHVLLTPREREVAMLVARGLTNRQIATQLIVTTGTAAIHVEHIRKKLGFHSRAEIARWVAEQGWLAARPA